MGDDAGSYLAFFAFALIAAAAFLLARSVVTFAKRLRSPDEEDRKNARHELKLFLVVSFGVAILLVFGIASYREVYLRIGDSGRYSTMSGRTITLHPSEVTFEVPQDWIDWNLQFHNNFHLSHRELRQVKEASGEWDTEYSEVVNEALPFDGCATHVGGEGWGSQGVSFGDLQVRAYVLDQPFRAVLERVQKDGMAVARRIAQQEGGMSGSEAAIETVQDSGWNVTRISYPLWYGDYGGTAAVTFMIKDLGRYRLVLVLMGWGQDGEAESLIKSVRLPKT